MRFWRYGGCACMIQYVLVTIIATNGLPSLSKSQIQAQGKVLFRALRDSECKVRCKSGKNRPVCGTDGITYQSKCELKRAKRCEGKNVDVKKKGKCSAKDVPMTKCFQEKEEALSRSSGTSSAAEDVFIPDCKKDGTYEEVQCHTASGYCWCVSKEGRPHTGTSTQHSKPNCKAKKHLNKSSSSKNRRRKGKGGSNSNECSSSERTKFNSNLIKVFTEEYNRSMRAYTTPPPARVVSDPVLDTLEKQVVEWKFSQYDKDHDNTLRRKEVKTLRKLVKKFIKPRACAKQFLKYCDSDKNRLIERSEWTLCLGVDINHGKATEAPPRRDRHDGNTAAEDKPFFPPPSIPRGPGPEPWGSRNSRPPRINAPALKPDREDKPRDCLSELAAALRQDAENPGGNIFVPNCTNGKWARAQCHNKTGYCWCVDENYGLPIVGTATFKVKPKCDFDAEREMKGCAYSRKRAFVSQILNQLTAEMTEYATSNRSDNSNLPAPDTSKSLPERVVRWKFALMDTSKNDILERGELDAFKAILRKNREKYTRKCSRNFIRYCDESGDKKISLEEWIDCMGVSRSGHFNGNLPVNPKRNGTNPFDAYLIDT